MGSKPYHFVILSLALALSGCSPRAQTPRVASAVLITVDTLRGDCLGASGQPDARTPYMDRFLRRGTQFTAAFSASPMTLPSHTTLLTGEWPTNHGVSRNGVRVPDRLRTLAEILHDAGFVTAAFVSSAALDPKFNLNQGFDVYNFRPVVGTSVDDAWRPAPRTVHRAVTWWTETSGRKFLWVHVFEPHVPYEPPAPFNRLYDRDYAGRWSGSSEDLQAIWTNPGSVTPRDVEHIVSLYEGEVTAVDRGLGELFRALEDDHTVVVLTADHGESMGEHKLLFKHGPYIYPGDVRIPLGVCGGSFRHAVDGAIARTVDVAPTLLSQLGVSAPLPKAGCDLATPVRDPSGFVSFSVASIGRYRVGTSAWDEELATDLSSPDLMRVARTAQVACVEAPWESRLEWYDRTVDPAELHPLSLPGTAEAQALRLLLDHWVEGSAAPAPVVEDARLQEALRSLGYVSH